MCGHETPSTTPRIGARVDFFSLTRGGHLPLGNLLFLNPSSPSSSHATYIRFQQPSPPLDATDNSNDSQTLLVSIHTTGDLTKPLSAAGLMQQFTLHHTTTTTTIPSFSHGPETMMPLAQALSLNVGDDGTIGRRVSMRRGEEVLADGIVGFNFAPVAVAAISC